MSEECIESWEKLAAAGRIADAIVEFVRERDWVTFPELQSYFEGFLATTGEHSWELDNNLVVWSGMSLELCSLLVALRDAKRLFVWPCNTFCYFVDGGSLRLPIAKSTRKYKNPHWLVCCFRTKALTQENWNENKRIEASHMKRRQLRLKGL